MRTIGFLSPSFQARSHMMLLSSSHNFAALCVKNANWQLFHYLAVLKYANFPKFIQRLIYCSFKNKKSYVISVERQLATFKMLFSDFFLLSYKYTLGKTIINRQTLALLPASWARCLNRPNWDHRGHPRSTELPGQSVDT